MRGYKGMTKNMTCRNMQFEVGKTYHVDGEIKMCENGLHFCQNLVDVFCYYRKNWGNRYFEVETDKPVFSDEKKSVTAELTILRELTDIEVNRAYYGGYGANNHGNGHGNGYYNNYDEDYDYGYGDGHGYNYSYNWHNYGNGDNGMNNGDGDGNSYCNIQNILVFND